MSYVSDFRAAMNAKRYEKAFELAHHVQNGTDMDEAFNKLTSRTGDANFKQVYGGTGSP